MIFLFRFPQFRPKIRKMFLSLLEMGSFFRHLNILTSPEPESMRHFEKKKLQNFKLFKVDKSHRGSIVSAIV